MRHSWHKVSRLLVEHDANEWHGLGLPPFFEPVLMKGRARFLPYDGAAHETGAAGQGISASSERKVGDCSRTHSKVGLETDSLRTIKTRLTVAPSTGSRTTCTCSDIVCSSNYKVYTSLVWISATLSRRLFAASCDSWLSFHRIRKMHK